MIPPLKLAPQTLIHGRYQIVRLLGKGGMGAVYEAMDLRIMKTVALKQQTLLSGEQLDRAFEREATLLARLEHPALPEVSDFFSDENGRFIVMRYVPGDDVEALLTRQNHLFTVERVLGWAEQLLDVLIYLHDHSPPIIHRDIKPLNIKVKSNDQIVLLDFGLAKGSAIQTRMTSTGSIFGYTLNYAPLEQIHGSGTDARTDLYALAGTLYYMLTCKAPIDALTRATAQSGERPDPLRPVHEVYRKVPVAISAVLHQALAMNPDKRPANAAAMLAALQAARRAPVSAPLRSESAPLRPKSTPPLSAPLQSAFEPPRSESAPPPVAAQSAAPAELNEAPVLEPDAAARAELSEEHAPAPASQQPSLATPAIAKAARSSTLLSATAKLLPARRRWWLAASLAIVIVLAVGALVSWNLLTRPVSVKPVQTTTIRQTAQATLTISTASFSDQPTSITLGEQDGPVYSVALSPDGKILASAAQNHTRLWQVSDRQVLQTLTTYGATHSVAFAPDGQTLATGSKDGSIKLWRVSDGQPIREFKGHTAGVTSVTFARDGQTLASGADDHSIKLWQVSDGSQIRTLSGHSLSVTSVAFSQDGQMLASSSIDSTVQLWRVSDGANLKTVKADNNMIESVAFALNGQILAAASEDHTVTLWQLSDASALRKLVGHTNVVTSVAFAPDGQTLATGSADHTIKLWRISDGALLRTLEGHAAGVTSLAFLAGGSMLVSGSEDQTMRLWSWPIKP